MQRTDIVYSMTDDVYLHPEKAIPQETLQRLEKYQLFTGVGIVATFEDDLIGDTKVFLKSKKAIPMAIKRHNDKELVSTEECFYVYAVKQKADDVFDAVITEEANHED